MIGTHDRAKMAAERGVGREARQSAVSAELETRSGSGGQPCPIAGAVTGAGVSDGACAFGVAEADTERKVLRVADSAETDELGIADSAEIDELGTGLEARTYGHEEGSPAAAPASNALSNRVTPKFSSSGFGIRGFGIRDCVSEALQRIVPLRRMRKPHSTNAPAVSTCTAASPQVPNRPRAESDSPCQEQSESESCSKIAARQQEEVAVLVEAVPRDATSMSAEGGAFSTRIGVPWEWFLNNQHVPVRVAGNSCCDHCRGRSRWAGTGATTGLGRSAG